MGPLDEEDKSHGSLTACSSVHYVELMVTILTIGLLLISVYYSSIFTNVEFTETIGLWGGKINVTKELH